MVNKSQKKLGMFDVSSKVSFQKGLRAFHRQQLAEKKSDLLSDKERKMLSGATVLRGKNFSKSGLYKMKGMPKNAFQSTTSNNEPEVAPQGTPADRLNAQLLGSTQISVKDFLGSSPTGVFSQKDVNTGVKQFAKELKQASTVKSVKQVGTGTESELKVGRDYQTAQFKFNPKTLTFTTKGWGVDIPDNFIKKSNNLFVAPTKKYTSYDYYKKSDSGKRSSKEKFGTYTPTKIYLQDGGKKISKIVDYDIIDFKDYYKDTDKYYKERYESKPYLSKQQVYFDTGLLKQKKDWDEYMKYYKYDKDDDTTTRTRERDVFLKEQADYNPTGFLSEYKKWTGFDKREKRKYTDDGRQIKEYGGTYLQDWQEYGDDGTLSRRRQYDDYIIDEDIDYGRNSGYDRNRKSFLEKEQEFEAGYKLAEYRYGDYVSDVDKKRKKRVYRYYQNRDRAPKDLGTVKEFNMNPESSQYYGVTQKVDAEGNVVDTVLIYDENIGIEPSKKLTITRDTALKTVKFFDPFTGKPIESFKYW